MSAGKLAAIQQWSVGGVHHPVAGGSIPLAATIP